jgi:hypothetical protein
VERIPPTGLDEFFRPVFRTSLYETVKALQANLDAWLRSYNYERPHQGLRNLVDRTDRRDLCIFQIGLRYIERCLINAIPFRIQLCSFR